jgi:hypothetical protein
MTSPTPSPLTEASANSLDEYFARKPPYDATTLAAIKSEFRRLRAKFGEDAASGKPTRAKKAAKVPQSNEITLDIFAADEEPLK